MANQLRSFSPDIQRARRSNAVSSFIDRYENAKKINAEIALERQRLKLQKEATDIEQLKLMYERKDKALKAMADSNAFAEKYVSDRRAEGMDSATIAGKLGKLIRENYLPNIYPDEETASFVASTVQSALAGNPKKPSPQDRLAATLKGINPDSLQPQPSGPNFISAGGQVFPNPDRQGVVADRLAAMGASPQPAQSSINGFTGSPMPTLPPDTSIGLTGEGAVTLSGIKPTKTFTPSESADIGSIQELSNYISSIENDISNKIGAGPGWLLSSQAGRLPGGAYFQQGKGRVLSNNLNAARQLVTYGLSGKQVNEMERKQLRDLIPTDTEIAKNDTLVINEKINKFKKKLSGIQRRVQSGVVWDGDKKAFVFEAQPTLANISSPIANDRTGVLSDSNDTALADTIDKIIADRIANGGK